ncbi:MAG: hypothetical protein A2V21_303010 [Deltaproteobacteria bacterium GWC2_55_46]|nr:MAG: hypothetical protein A2Z79_05650 [Deltaproteobacteria bacterium GWA2_55_82]OGQ62445.1 MAG: hypothetical protein A3I81_01395 [Deltaproteobacteria bacterium RIFCSPLOWO2_02_FULL_55_12]OIJ75030.1 MAG: hypothetical protein A2V21_303010 [Deltaproteobacteria bacterium GWC2_55_46]
MLGKLARWMRTLGYDVEYDTHIEDTELIKRATAEQRLILTRDTRLIERRGARKRVFFIKSDLVGEQLRQVAGEFPPDDSLLLTRCLRCNALLKDVPKESVKAKVPPYVFQTQAEFSVCPVCQRTYWGATHRERMLEDLRKFLE